MTKSFHSKTDNPNINQQLQDLFFEIRNGCVSAALIASGIYAVKNNYNPNSAQLRLMVSRLLNPEEDTKRPAGVATLFPTLKELSALNLKTGSKPLMPKSKKNEYTITEDGKIVLKLMIEELKRITNHLEDLSG
jgi:hypothetical protein